MPQYDASNAYPHAEPVVMVKSDPPLTWGQTIGGLFVLLILVAFGIGILRFIFSPAAPAVSPVIVNNIIPSAPATPIIVEKEKPVYVERERVVEKRVEVPVVVEREKRVVVDRPVYIERPVVVEKTVVVPSRVIVVGSSSPDCVAAEIAHAERVRTYRTIIGR